MQCLKQFLDNKFNEYHARGDEKYFLLYHAIVSNSFTQARMLECVRSDSLGLE